MRTDLPNPGDIAAFSFDPEQPTYWVERLSHYMLEQYKAMAGANFQLDDGQVEPGSEAEFAWGQAWDQQTATIKRQQERLEDIQSLLSAKKAALPTQGAIQDLKDAAIEGGSSLLLGWFLDGLTASEIGEMLGGITIPLVMSGVETLAALYDDGFSLMTGIVTGLDSLINGLEQDEKNFEMRANVIAQNEQTLSNFLDNMTATEKHVGGAGATSVTVEGTQSDSAPTSDTNPIEEDESFLEVWEGQTLMLQEQQDRFTQVQELLNSKAAALPKEDALQSLVDSAIEGGTDLLIGWLLQKVAVSALGGMLGGITIPLLWAGVETLKNVYFNGDSLVDGLIKGIVPVVSDMTPSRENYELRSNLLEQNETRLSSFLAEMMSFEQHIGGDGTTTAVASSTSSELSKINDSIMFLARNDASIICPHTGKHIYRKSLTQGN